MHILKDLGTFTRLKQYHLIIQLQIAFTHGFIFQKQLNINTLIEINTLIRLGVTFSNLKMFEIRQFEILILNVFDRGILFSKMFINQLFNTSYC